MISHHDQKISYNKTAFMAIGDEISIVIVNYNGLHDLQISLPSIEEHLPAGSEVIFVDNNSTDASGKYVLENFPQFKFIDNTENNGFGSGNNLGVEAATREYLVFLNPDTKVEPCFAERLIEPLKQNPDVGMTTSKVLILKDPDYINTCGNKVHLTGLTLCRGYRAHKEAEAYQNQEDVTAVSGASFAMRRDLFLELGGFDPLFFLYMEDTDLSLRVRLAGYRCLYVPDSVVHHDYSLRIGSRKIYFQERNRYIMLLKIFRWRTLFLLFPAFLIAEIIAWGFVIVLERKNFSNKIKAYWDIINEWNTIQDKRAATQSTRQISDADLLQMSGYKLDFEQTGDTIISKVAHLIFDPIFYVWKRITLVIIQW